MFLLFSKPNDTKRDNNIMSFSSTIKRWIVKVSQFTWDEYNRFYFNVFNVILISMYLMSF